MTQREAFRAGFLAGFSVSREGFNGECSYDHLAPRTYDKTIASEIENQDRGSWAELMRLCDIALTEHRKEPL